MIREAIGFAEFDNDIFNTSDNTTMRYIVTQSDQIAHTITSSITEDMCGGPALVNDITVASVWPFSQKKPQVGVILNPKNHYGLAGDKITAFWNEALENYEVVDVSRHNVSMSRLSIVTENGCTTIYDTPLEIAIETCGASGQPSALLSYRTQQVSDVTDIRLAKNAVEDQGETTCTPKLVVDLVRYTALVICEVGTPATVDMDLISKVVIVDVDFDGCPSALEQNVIVFDVCDDARLIEADCEPCPTEGEPEPYPE